MKSAWVHLLWAVGLGVALYWGWNGKQRLEQLDRELAKLQAKESSAAPVAIPETGKAEDKEEAKPQGQQVREIRIDVAPYLREIDELRARVETLDRQNLELRQESAAFSARFQEQDVELKRLGEAVRAAEEEVRLAGRLTEALQAELKQKTDRMLKAEQAEKVLQERVRKAEATQRQALQSAKEIEDLNRQREATLVALSRRFRDVTDVLRRFSLEQNRAASGLGLQTGDLSRVQSAVEQAEEDLRQLRSLNARVEELSRVK
jgi:chromosome segregation ATPase